MSALRGRGCRYLLGEVSYCILQSRFYRSKVDLKKLQPMILKRIENRAKEYPVPAMVPVAEEFLKCRAFLIQGLSTLIKYFPVVACKFCAEVYVGGEGHLIHTCSGYKRRSKNVHTWVNGGVNDILVPVEAFHLHTMFQDVINHQQRFDFDRVPAVVELCWQAGAKQYDQNSNSDLNIDNSESLTPDDLRLLANGTLTACETLRSGVQKLLLVYPAKVCKSCSEVHVGPSGHKARLCGVFKYESWRGTHFWEKASVDNLVPLKLVWWRRHQDPPVLLNEGRDFYGHAPAVVALCAQAGAVVPSKYFCMMKSNGLSGPISSQTSHSSVS